MSAAGPALIFICLLLLETLLGAVVLTYAARCFTVIVEQTAAGSDAVTWPDEPMQDWLGRALHLLWLVAFWLAPVALVLRVLRHVVPGGSAALFFLPPVVLFWLLFPVSVLSSFSAVSRWVVFRPAVLSGLMRVLPATLSFYLVSALLLGGLGALAFVSFAGGILLLPVVAVAAATGVFVYARLLGRLGEQLAELEAPEAPQPESSAERPPARPRKKRRPVRGVKTIDPWAVPKKEEPPEAPNLKEEGYGLASEDRPAAREPEVKKKKVPRPRPYAVSPEKPPPTPAETPLDGYRPVGADAEPAPKGEERTGAGQTAPGRRPDPPRSERPRPPEHPFIQGVYTFPWYNTSVAPWLVVAGGLLAMGGVLLAMLLFAGMLQ